jgi:hypothetical protein
MRSAANSIKLTDLQKGEKHFLHTKFDLIDQLQKKSLAGSFLWL